MPTQQESTHYSDDDGRVDTGLIERVAAGDAQALAALYDRTHQLVYSIALRILRNPYDAEETTVDVFVQIWRRAQSFDSTRGNPLAWTAMMARSRAIDRLRSLANQAQVEACGDDMVSDIPASDGDPEKVGFLAEIRYHIQKALDRLSPEQRVVIEGAYFRGLTHSELARQLNLPLGTVKQRIRLGIIRLRKYLRPSEFAGFFECLPE